MSSTIKLSGAAFDESYPAFAGNEELKAAVRKAFTSMKAFLQRTKAKKLVNKVTVKGVVYTIEYTA